MPKTPCPACNAAVKYPKDADPGTEVTCPECDEVFVPPELRLTVEEPEAGPRRKEYDLDEEETYKAERPIADPDAGMKARRLAAAAHHARRQRREQERGVEKPFFGGPEVVFLFLAVALALGLPLGFAVAKRWPSAGEGVLIGLAYCGVFFAFGFKMWRGRKRVGG